MASEIGEAPASGLGKLLQDERFLVPTHQRDYSWSIDEVALLLDDVEGALDRGDKQYFVGLMVFMGSEGPHFLVLDGQQRLATAVLYFSAVRSWLRQYTEYNDDANKVDEWFIGRRDLGKEESEPRIVLNSANHQTFLDYIVKSVPPEDIRRHLGSLKRYDRNRKLLEAAIYCHERVASIAKNGTPKDVADKLFRTVTYFRDSVAVVRLNVRDDETAFTIFETLNDRGVELSPLDLVKNFLFRRAASQSRERLRDMEDRWIQLISTLSTVKADSFLKAFWTSRHGRIQATNLFGEFKKQYDKPDTALSASMDMLIVAEQYAALETADDPVWAPYSTSARERVRSLKLLGARQTHPILLAALSRFEPPEMERLLKLLEAVIVRYQLIGGGRTGRLETECARLAQAVFVKQVTDKTGTRGVTQASDVFREMRDIYPSDQTFEENFSVARESNNQKVVYILRSLEKEARLRERQERAAESEPGALSLEHILPRNPGDDWAPIMRSDPSVGEDCTYRLGNQCLMVAGENRDAAGRGFQEKKKTYARSDVILTRDVASHTKWDRVEIENRQAKMAKLAAAVWRFQ